MATSREASDVSLGQTASIDRCSGCGAHVALTSPTPALSARAWLCTRCGSVYFARRQGSDGDARHVSTRSVPYSEVLMAINVNLEPTSSRIRRSDVERLVQCMSERKFNGSDVRQQKRYPVAAPVTIVPLGADFRVIGKPARAMTTNISSGGAAIIHSIPLAEPYLAVDFAVAGVKLSPAILHVTRVRHLAMAYEIAGKLVSRILHGE